MAEKAAGTAAEGVESAKLTGEEARWAELAKELEGDDLADAGDEGETSPAEAKKAEGEGETAEEDKEPKQDAKPKPTYEELEAHSRRQAAAIQEERATAKQLKAQLQQFNQFVEELRAGRQQQARPEQEAPKQPSIEEDPIGHFQYEINRLSGVIQQLQQGTQQTAEQLQQRTQEQAFWAYVERSEQEIRTKVPDYDAACQHLESARVAELEVMLPDDSPRAQAIAEQYGLQSPAELRLGMLNRDRIAVAQQAVQLGMSPAELYYRLAKQRGYQGKGAVKGGAAAAEAVIEAARRGQQAAKTISGGGGKPDKTMTLSDLADLYGEDPEEFDKQWDKMARAGKLG